jgi:hypothetical protein
MMILEDLLLKILKKKHRNLLKIILINMLLRKKLKLIKVNLIIKINDLTLILF